jgi:hypothetical protein
LMLSALLVDDHDLVGLFKTPASAITVAPSKPLR